MLERNQLNHGGNKMAWTDQCKIAFKTNATALLYKQRGRHNVTAVLKTLHEGSGIPLKTLKRWYYEKEKCLKNEPHETTIENDSKIIQIDFDCGAQESSVPCCKRCHIHPIVLHTITKKPYSSKSKYFGLCNNCRKEIDKTEKLKLDANKENGDLIACPKCNHTFYIKKGG